MEQPRLGQRKVKVARLAQPKHLSCPASGSENESSQLPGPVTHKAETGCRHSAQCNLCEDMSDS